MLMPTTRAIDDVKDKIEEVSRTLTRKQYRDMLRVLHDEFESWISAAYDGHTFHYTKEDK